MDLRLMNGSQIKAARALLGWSQDTLAVNSTVSVKTIARAESADTLPEGWATSAMIKTLENNGITFVDDRTALGVLRAK
jgi:DNA-binding transcriptional regulator YiaG